jgi:hypothetical protein
MLALVLIGLGEPLAAGIVYDFEATHQEPRSIESVSGRIWFDGKRYRAEVKRAGRPAQVIVSHDGDNTTFSFDPQKETWSARLRGKTDIRSAGLFRWPVPAPRVKKAPKIEYQRKAGGSIAGQSTILHEIQATFDVDSRIDDAPVRGTYRVYARIWSAEHLPEPPLQRSLRTGYPLVDRQLDKVTHRIKGMVMRHELDVVRTMEGGLAQTERMVSAVVHLVTGEIEEQQFAIPPAFEYENEKR